MVNRPKITILAIETSCDETAAAVLRIEKNGEIPETTTLSSAIKSQISLHKKMGGVVPEVAARAHVKNILPIVQKALHDAALILEAIDYIAVTQGPGLIPSLIVGVEFAKALSLATGIPLIPINHMAGHLYSPLSKISQPTIRKLFPMISLIVSGGHTILILMKSPSNYIILGQTVDDAGGEAFDKVAKLLKLPYPGGPEVSKLAEQGKPTINFPRPMVHSKDYNFSFAGLKTAVLYYAQDQGLKIKDTAVMADICASFEAAVVDVLLIKTLRAVKQYKGKSISLAGGVSANKPLRAAFEKLAKDNDLISFIPFFHLATDNAEMIALAAAFKLSKKFKPKPLAKIQANPNLELAL